MATRAKNTVLFLLAIHYRNTNTSFLNVFSYHLEQFKLTEFKILVASDNAIKLGKTYCK